MKNKSKNVTYLGIIAIEDSVPRSHFTLNKFYFVNWSGNFIILYSNVLTPKGVKSNFFNEKEDMQLSIFKILKSLLNMLSSLLFATYDQNEPYIEQFKCLLLMYPMMNQY